MEVLCALGLFALLSLVAAFSLRQMTRIWQRTSARDMALRRILAAEQSLMRDLINSSRGVGRSAWGPAPCGAGAVPTGDALALVVPARDQSQLVLSSSGVPVADRIVTYYLAVPAQVNAEAGVPQSFAPDSAGYEDQCAFKWLIRKEELVVPPAGLPANWLQGGVVEVPTFLWREPMREVVATQLLQFRVLQGPPTWELSVTAVAIGDARRNIGLGGVPLSSTPYAIVHRFGVVAKN